MFYFHLELRIISTILQCFITAVLSHISLSNFYSRLWYCTQPHSLIKSAAYLLTMVTSRSSHWQLLEMSHYVTPLSLFVEDLLFVLGVDFQIYLRLIIKSLCVSSVFQWFGEIFTSGASVRCFQSVQSWRPWGRASAAAQQVSRLFCPKMFFCYAPKHLWLREQWHLSFVSACSGSRRCLPTRTGGTCCCLLEAPSGPLSGVLRLTGLQLLSTWLWPAIKEWTTSIMSTRCTVDLDSFNCGMWAS